jgi:hypothetical protein
MYIPAFIAGAMPFTYRHGKLMATTGGKQRIVYAKKTFAGPKQVLEYLGRYTHRVAISNSRILNAELLTASTSSLCSRCFLSSPRPVILAISFSILA